MVIRAFQMKIEAEKLNNESSLTKKDMENLKEMVNVRREIYRKIKALKEGKVSKPRKRRSLGARR